MVTPDKAAVHESAGGVADRLRDLMRFAAAGRAPAAWIDETAAVLVDALLELAEYRSGDRDPRRKRTLAIAQRVSRARQAGASVPELCERFGKSRASVYRLLSHDIARQNRCDMASVPLQENADARP